jgi:hypothetical protein
VLTLLGSVWVAKAAGIWQTSGRDQVLLDESGQPDPAGIKGWMTLATIAETYGIPLDVLYAMIGAGETIPPETELKELEKLVPGTEVWALREGVAAYLDGTWMPGDAQQAPESDNESGATPTLVPGEATPVPVEPTPAPVEPTTAAVEQGITPESSEDHVPQGPAGGGQGQGYGDGTGPESQLPDDGSPLPGSQIKGRMSLQEVIDLCQVPLEYLVAELGLPEDVDTQIRMRDLAGQLGIEVLSVREVVERYQAGQ